MKLTLFVNHACNLRCTYCYTGRKFQRVMPLSIAKRAIDLGLAEATLPAMQLAFFGGEPMLEPELMDAAVRYAREKAAERGARIIPTVATNGTLLGTKRLALLKEHGFGVQVSVDGGQLAQDATRRFRNGHSSFARVAKNLKELLAAGFAVRVVAVVDPQNAEHLADSFDRLYELGVRHLQFSPNYNGAWDDAACERLERALGELGDRYITRFRAGENTRLDPLSGKIVTHLTKGYEQRFVCKFGQQELAVAPTGRIYPCDRLVAEDDDDAICLGDLDRGIDEEKRRALVARKNAPDAECEACELRKRCMHWCGCANYETTGDVGGTSPIVCYFERAFIAEADRIANALYEEGNPTFIKRFYGAQLSKPTS
ncbi:MAG: radical SAM protein [Deltaproteobacteria bacterium]|nr:radical SAM protein [Deltaproteobacteria bacterium]